MTNLIEDLGKIRDLLEEQDYDKMERAFPVFIRSTEALRTNYKKFIRDTKHYLDFNSYDMEEIAEEIKPVIKKINQLLSFKRMRTFLYANGEDKYTQKYVQLFRVRSILTEYQSVLLFVGTCLRLFEEGKAKSSYER